MNGSGAMTESITWSFVVHELLWTACAVYLWLQALLLAAS